MYVSEVIGVLVLQCSCGKKFVVNTEIVKNGFQLVCSCGRGSYHCPNAKLEVSIRPGTPINQLSKEQQRYYHKAMLQSNAVPLEEYKRTLADFIITGKKPKVNKAHSQVVNFDTDEQQYQNLYETLRQLGIPKEEAFAKIDVALKEGLRMETEIIKYILSMN